MNRVLVAGLGTDLRGDDAAGLLVARALSGPGMAGVDVEEHHRDAASLAESMSRHAEVLLVDAVAADGEPGTVLELTPEAEALRGATSSHGLGLRHAVALARAMGADPSVRVLGITGRNFALGAEPSPAVVRAAAGVAVRIREMYPCA
jgi:hydrogenase maturation protease